MFRQSLDFDSNTKYIGHTVIVNCGILLVINNANCWFLLNIELSMFLHLRSIISIFILRKSWRYMVLHEHLPGYLHLIHVVLSICGTEELEYFHVLSLPVTHAVPLTESSWMLKIRFLFNKHVDDFVPHESRSFIFFITFLTV